MLKSDALCGFSEFVIFPDNCQLRKHKSLTLARSKLNVSKTTYAVFHQNLEDNLEDSCKRLEAGSINFLRCKIQNLILLTLAMQLKLHPSQLLSALLSTQLAYQRRHSKQIFLLAFKSAVKEESYSRQPFCN